MEIGDEDGDAEESRWRRRVVASVVCLFSGAPLSLFIVGYPRWGAKVAAGLTAAWLIVPLISVMVGGGWIWLVVTLGSAATAVTTLAVVWSVRARDDQPGQSWSGYLLAALLCFLPGAAAWLARQYIAEPMEVAYAGMAPTMVSGDYFTVRKGFFAGEIVTGSIIAFTRSETDVVPYVSRVAALPGQVVEVWGGGLIVDGVALPFERVTDAVEHRDHRCEPVPGTVWREELPGGDTHLIKLGGPSSPGLDSPAYTVPPGTLYVVSDNRDASLDSRTWGVVAEAQVLGSVSAVQFSYDPCHLGIRWERIGRIR